MNKFDVTLHFFYRMINHLEQFFFLCLTIFFLSRCISALVIASRARKQAKEKQFSFFCLSFCICFAVCRSSQNNMVEAKSLVSLAPKWISKSRKWQRKPKKNNAPVTSRTLNTTDKSKKKHILINCCYLCSLVSNGALFRVRKKNRSWSCNMCLSDECILLLLFYIFPIFTAK